MSQQKPSTPYEILGGHEAVEAIVAHFYQLIDVDPAYKELRALHAADLAPIQHGLTQFLNSWLGGPKDWFERGQCVMSLHRRFPINTGVAEQWADAMKRSISAQPHIDKTLGRAMTERLSHMAQAMVNTTSEQQIDTV